MLWKALIETFYLQVWQKIFSVYFICKRLLTPQKLFKSVQTICDSSSGLVSLLLLYCFLARPLKDGVPFFRVMPRRKVLTEKIHQESCSSFIMELMFILPLFLFFKPVTDKTTSAKPTARGRI